MEDAGLLDNKEIYAAGILICFFLSGAVYALNIPFLSDIFTNDFGIFSNLTIIAYSAVIFLTLKSYIRGNNLPKPKEAQAGNFPLKNHLANNWNYLLIAFLSFLMIGDEVKWFIPFLANNPGDYSVFGLKDIVIAALSKVPEKSGLNVVMAIAAVRFFIIAGILYFIGFLLFYRKLIIAFINKPRSGEYLFYGGMFGLFIILSLITAAYGFRGSAVFEQSMELCASMSLLGYVLEDLIDEQRKTMHSGDPDSDRGINSSAVEQE